MPVRGLLGAVLLAISCVALAELQLTTAQAKSHVGEKATVCGTVASAKYAARAKGMPTFLNLDKPFPDHIFTAVIWGHNRPRFPTPPESLTGSFICVSGFITSYRNVPQIIVNDPSQIGQ
ncbi:MAG: DNA-binding protein [Gammaproteobacteria bacterium]|nr:DNA-binding protein [Gammaproteobacteria bacterium]MBU1415151.1 DNA-binding protein [Gammaproteobacteria bacterium]